ncbi:MAG: response regulator [Patescibacteria group bacterium]
MPHLLLIEDDESLVAIYKAKFEKEGFMVSAEKDGEGGLRSALLNHPDIILIDIKIPKMDGMMVMKKLREDKWGEKVPIIIITNFDVTDGQISELVEDHPAYYLFKANTTLDEMVDRVREVLETSSSERG